MRRFSFFIGTLVFSILTLIAIYFGLPKHDASEHFDNSRIESKIMVSGNEIVYNGDIENGDYIYLSSLIKTHPEVTDIKIQSRGGIAIEGYAISRLITDNGLNTETFNNGYCYSACVYVFAGGVQRTTYKNTEFGFHAPGISSGVDLTSLSNEQLRSAINISSIVASEGVIILIERGVDIDLARAVGILTYDDVRYMSGDVAYRYNLATKLK